VPVDHVGINVSADQVVSFAFYELPNQRKKPAPRSCSVANVRHPRNASVLVNNLEFLPSGLLNLSRLRPSEEYGCPLINTTTTNH
jgi:hypothetical protein